MEKNTFDASVLALKSRLVFEPILPVETRSASRPLVQICSEANLLFQTVDVLGIVPNQLASITQTKNEAMCYCWHSVLISLTHLGDVTVEERRRFRIMKN